MLNSQNGINLGIGQKCSRKRSRETEMEVEAAINTEVDDKVNENNLIPDEFVDSFSVPGFLRKVFAAELGDDGRDRKLIVIAVHAVLLESGFVALDDKARIVVDGFQLRNDWPSDLFRVSLFYTLPECPSGEGRKSVVLKFQSLGKYMIVYGSLCDKSGKGTTYRVQLNEGELVSFLNVVWANYGMMEYAGSGSGSTTPQKEVLKFWEKVKHNLALPLMIDLCEESDLELPPCFTRLPSEVKLKILESMRGVDVARVSCVCSELRYLGSKDDLWKLRFDKEFGNGSGNDRGRGGEEQVSWKKAFSKAWLSRRVTGRHNPHLMSKGVLWRRRDFTF